MEALLYFIESNKCFANPRGVEKWNNCGQVKRGYSLGVDYSKDENNNNNNNNNNDDDDDKQQQQ